MLPTRFHLRNNWRPIHAVLALLAVTVAVLATWDAWADMFFLGFKDEEASHVLLVPLVFAWLVWVRRHRLYMCEQRHLWVGPVIIICGAVMAHIGYINAMQAMWHFGSVVVAVGAAVSVLGVEVLLKFFPAVVVLGFLVPVPGEWRSIIADPLQTANASVTAYMLSLFGFVVEQVGNTLSINGQKVEIVEACNGMRMVFTLVMVSYAYAFGTPLHNYVRILILAASPVSAILCNVIRLAPTILMYGYADQASADMFHDVAGWVMVAIGFFLLMGILRLLRWLLIPVAPYTLAYE